MGLPNRQSRELASAHVAFVNGGRKRVRQRTPRRPSHESPVARRQHGPALPPVVAIDASPVEQRHGRRIIRVASAARRIRRLGGGAQRYAEHFFWITRALCLREARHARIRKPNSELGNKSEIRTSNAGMRRFTFHVSRFTFLFP